MTQASDFRSNKLPYILAYRPSNFGNKKNSKLLGRLIREPKERKKDRCPWSEYVIVCVCVWGRERAFLHTHRYLMCKQKAVFLVRPKGTSEKWGCRPRDRNLTWSHGEVKSCFLLIVMAISVSSEHIAQRHSLDKLVVQIGTTLNRGFLWDLWSTGKLAAGHRASYKPGLVGNGLQASFVP